MIVIPDHIDFTTWASTLQVDLLTIDVPVISSESEWKLWALFLIEENELTQLPLPYRFDSWRHWADYLVNYL